MTSIVRDETRHLHPHPGVTIKEGDVLLIKGDPEDLEEPRAVARGIRLLHCSGSKDETVKVTSRSSGLSGRLRMRRLFTDITCSDFSIWCR